MSTHSSTSGKRDQFEREVSKNAPPLEQQNTANIDLKQLRETKEGLSSAAEALQHGKMPTTAQVTGAIDKMKETDLSSGVQLSQTGQKVAQKVDKALDSTKDFLTEKNEGDVLQRLIHHSKLASKNLDVDTPDLGSEARDAQKLLNRAYSQMVLIANLIVTSGEFRGLAHDVYSLVREILADNVPGAERLPESHEVIDQRGNLNKEKLKEGASVLGDRVTQQAAVAGSDAVQKAGEIIEPHARDAKHRQLNEGNKEAGKKQGQELLQKGKAQAQEATNEARNIASNIVNDAQLTEEQKEQLTSRLIGILDEVQTNSEYRKAIEGFIDILGSLKELASDAVDKTSETAGVNQAKEDDNIKLASQNARKAVENFAGKKSLNKLIKAFQNFQEKAEKDETTKRKFKELNSFLHRSLKDNKFVHQKDYPDQASNLLADIRTHLTKNYRKNVDEVMTELTQFNNAIQEDPTTNTMIKDLESLTSELFLDEKGRPTVKYDLLNDFTKFVPVLASKMEILQIPRLEDSDEDYEYILDNITLRCSNIVPRLVHVRTDTEFNTEKERIENAVSIKMHAINASAENVAFYYKKRVALMNLEDAGIVTVKIPDEGMDIYIKLLPRIVSDMPEDVQVNKKHAAFRVESVRCKVNQIKISTQHTKYQAIYSLFSRLIQSRVRKEIEENVAKGVRNFLESVDAQITGANSKEQAKLNAKPGVYTEKDTLDSHPEGWKSDAFTVKAE